MTLELSAFLYIYLLFLLFWLAFSNVALYHMFKFGFKNIVTYLSIFIYISVSGVILFTSFMYIVQIDWSQNVLDTKTLDDNSTFWQN